MTKHIDDKDLVEINGAGGGVDVEQNQSLQNDGPGPGKPPAPTPDPVTNPVEDDPIGGDAPGGGNTGINQG